MKCSVSTERRLGFRGKLWEQLENYSAWKKKKKNPIWYVSKRFFVFFSTGSGMLCCCFESICTYRTWRVWVWAGLFASLCTPRGGTIAGFCPVRPWEEGDRRVNEWRGFWDASAQGHDEGVGGRALNSTMRRETAIQSPRRKTRMRPRAHTVNKGCRWNQAIHPPSLWRMDNWARRPQSVADSLV